MDLGKTKRLLAARASELRRKRIGVVYGPKSEEDAFYIANSPPAQLGISSIKSAMNGLVFDWKICDPASPSFINALQEIEIAFLAVHGEYCEDGRLQGLLDYLSIPYTGSGVLASAIGLNKVAFKRIMLGHNLPTPDFKVLENDLDLRSQLESMLTEIEPPWLAKPISGGSSIGIGILESVEEAVSFLEKPDNREKSYFIERIVPGRSVTVGILELVGESVALPALEVETSSLIYDQETKLGRDHNTKPKYYIPPRVEASIIEDVQKRALEVHSLIGARGFSRLDFIIGRHDDINILEINTLPGLSMDGNYANAARAFGLEYEELIVAIADTARPR